MTSPDSASCSTRCGSGVCGGGWRSDARVVRGCGVRAVALRLATADLAVLQDGAVVRRVAPRARRRAHSRAGGGSGWAGCPRGRGRVRLRRLPAEQAVAQRRQLDRHLVDGRRGDDQHAEERDEGEQRHDDVRRAEQVEQQAGDDVADRAAALLERAGVAEGRLRVAGRDVDDAEDAEGQRQPADELTSRRAVALGVAHVAHPDDGQHDRDQPADLADRAGHDRANGLGGAARQLPPRGRGRDDTQADQQEADAVATVLGVELAGGAADASGDRPDAVGDRQPGRGDAAAQEREEAEDRTRAAAHGARSGPARRRASTAAGRLACWLRTAGSGARAALRRALGGSSGGRAPAPRPRRGRRPGRHADDPT